MRCDEPLNDGIWMRISEKGNKKILLVKASKILFKDLMYIKCNGMRNPPSWIVNHRIQNCVPLESNLQM